MSSFSSNNRVFGQATRRPNGRMNSNSRYQRQMGQSVANQDEKMKEDEDLALRRIEMRKKKKEEGEALDERFGFVRYCSQNRGQVCDESRRGWIFNMLATTVPITADDTNGQNLVGNSSIGESMASNSSSLTSVSDSERSGVDLYFLTAEGSTFKSTVLYDPYFYIITSDASKISSHSQEDDECISYEALISTLLRLYEPLGLKTVESVYKKDLDTVNHLGESGRKGKLMFKLSFDNVQQLMDVRKEIQNIVRNNKEKSEESNGDGHHNLIGHNFGIFSGALDDAKVDPITTIIDIREYDVPYVVRVCIDLNIRSGAWYTATPNTHDCGVTLSNQDIETKANPSFLAFDIECTKAPLKFPDANFDSIYMISYMVNGQGYLILSTHVVSEDVADFEYTPKPGYPGPFHIFNERTEEDLIRRFLAEWQRIRPQICVTYNGDFFDFPFLQQRAAVYNLDLSYELGIEASMGASKDGTAEGEYRGRCCIHLDAFSWVKRDSYLPQGSQGLKAVTKYKLGYDPVEVDPEDMMRCARERPIHMASYSVSDAVATYYLYEKYVHLFIFSLCTIIPMGPEDVLRKGSGTLCEALLMVQSCTKDVICPNKQIDPLAKFHDGHLLESETYIGGKVECLESGVYRSDVEYKFDLKSDAFQGLIDNVDRDLAFAIEVEGGLEKNKITNYDEIRCQIIEKLAALRDRPNRVEKPFVYHLDVAAMYPNIILTNRLQPSAIVNDSICAACDFNQSKTKCKRKMDWTWRGDYSPASKSEYNHAKDQLAKEKLSDGRNFKELDKREQALMVKNRLKIYSKNAYRKTKIQEEIVKTDTVCMRENDFYVDTVRQFRDRRYEYKGLTKKWGKRVREAKDAVTKKDAEARALVYDSLQVAHKCILNSFYGYVMRKGARWRSMEMAGIVTKTGSDIITQARILVEQIGRPLELDTDGIWCILPQSFPDVYNFEVNDGSQYKLEYPKIMLNADVHKNFSNHQYQTLKNPTTGVYETKSECSIFFEVDGPYRCMVLPSSTEEGKLLKKRYAVFNFDGSLAELKGFELKRRGELELIKTFQSQVFQRFLDGNTLVECYDSVAEIANHWLDVLDTQGESMETDELVDLVSENRNMSRQLEDYGDQKGTSQTTARRLGEFLGAEIIKDKGLNCKFIIAEQPYGAPVTERAIPTAIWKAEPAVMKNYLRKWLKSPTMEADDFEICNILDWDYYRNRLGKTIQKIITIPAALQKIANPVPRIPHPEWLQRTVRRLNDPYKQQSIKGMFTSKAEPTVVTDIEDIGGVMEHPAIPMVHSKKRNRVALPKIQKVIITPQKEIITPEVLSINTVTKLDNVPVKLSKDSFQEWLLEKKKMWKFKEKRKRFRPKTSGQEGDRLWSGPKVKKHQKVAGSMAGYMKDAALALSSYDWHIVEVRELFAADESGSGNVSSSGKFIVWAMVGNGSLQKIQMAVPRMVYINCRKKIKEFSSNVMTVKQVERYLPHSKVSLYLYEVTLSEELYQKQDWLQHFCPSSDWIESVYEMKTPLLLRSLLHLGCISRVNPTAAIETKGRYNVSDLTRVDNPGGGEYLDQSFYKRIFLYEVFNTRNRTGIVATFILDKGGDKSQNDSNSSDHDISDPQKSDRGTYKLKTTFHLWIIKPGGEKSQKNISKKICETIFSQMVQQIKESTTESEDADYSCLSTDSSCQTKTVAFVANEKKAFDGANDVLNGYIQGNNGPTFLTLNCTKSIPQLRKAIPSFNSFPLIVLPFPPSPAYNASAVSLPPLNWEPQATQLCLESFLHMNIVSFPSWVRYSRFSQIPIGNLGTDAAVTCYDILLARHLQKSRAILWSNDTLGHPDLGYKTLLPLPGSNSSIICNNIQESSYNIDSNDIWGDEQGNIKPVVRCPGAYHSICVEINIHDMAIASLTDTNLLLVGENCPNLITEQDKSSNIVNAFEGKNSVFSENAPLGDEMSTALSLTLLRSLAQSWLRDASEFNSVVANQLLNDFYRLVSSPDAMLNDPTLHRVLVSLMKTTFYNLLKEFQRLGSKIISATFNRIIIATNKTHMADAKEYIDFVISTIQKKNVSGVVAEGLSRLSLCPHSFYSNYLFLDENNFGGIQFEARNPETDEENELSFQLQVSDTENMSEELTSIVPTVVSGWNIMHYLPNKISQQYFQAIIARFSKEVYQKHLTINHTKLTDLEKITNSKTSSKKDELLLFKKNLVSNQFASYLTRAVDEIAKGNDEVESMKLPGSYLSASDPILDFLKSVFVVLNLDHDIEREVQLMKKSLLAQIGVNEYSDETHWRNPSASFLLPDVFCQDCHESKDVDLCMVPIPDEGEEMKLICDDCGIPYDPNYIECKLVDILQRRNIRYQLQDLRCVKSGCVATRALAHHSESSGKLHSDFSKQEFTNQLLLLQNIAKFYNLELLNEMIQVLLC